MGSPARTTARRQRNGWPEARPVAGQWRAGGKERPWIGREELLSLGSMRAYVCGGGQREREGEITSRGDELGLDRG